MRHLVARLPEAPGLVLWGLACAVLGFGPGFAGPTYPASIIVGVVLAPVGAIVAANRVGRLVQGAAVRPSLESIVGCGVRAPALLLVVALAAAMLHGLRVGFCDLSSDLLRWCLGPGVGALAAGVWGALAGALFSRRRHCRWLVAVGLPLASYATSVGRFYCSPMVFAFDHFVGYFAGTLYDTELGPLERLWTYRLGTAGWMGFGLWLLALLRQRGVDAGVSRRLSRLGVIAGVASLTLASSVTLRGPEFGHFQTTESIERALHHVSESERCIVRFGPGVASEAANLLARECVAHMSELEAYFGVSAPSKIRVYLFQSADQKAWFMGARHVYIAKPWREEIYIQAAGFPHPVLRHELAHVVAGAMARGPFRVAGSLAGLIPDPGRIEGFAVAAAPPDDEPLTSHQWAAAMKELGLLPRLSELFQLGFFASNSSTAYTVAGAFVGWLRDEVGAGALRRWYGGAGLTDAAGRSLEELEASFLSSLERVELTESEVAAARARFDRPAVMARRCPYQVDARLAEGLALVAGGECEDARPVLEGVLATDPSALRAELGLAQCQQSEGDARAALGRYVAMAADDRVHSLFRAAAVERAGDLEWQSGRLEEAKAHYRNAILMLIEEDRLRQLEVKLAGLESSDATVRRAVAGVFFGVAGKAPLPVLTGYRLGQWVQAQDAALGHYLMGKQLWAAGEWEPALAHLRRAANEPELPVRVRREATRGVLVAACALGDRASVVDAAGRLADDRGFPAGSKLAWQAFARRCDSFQIGHGGKALE